MDSTIQTLLVVAITLFILYRSTKKKNAMTDETQPQGPLDTEQPQWPEQGWPQTHGFPQNPSKPATTPSSPLLQQSQTSTTRRQKQSNKSAKTSMYSTQGKDIAPPIADNEEVSEFAITSADDARKAVIWSEILQRKF